MKNIVLLSHNSLVFTFAHVIRMFLAHFNSFITSHWKFHLLAIKTELNLKRKMASGKSDTAANSCTSALPNLTQCSPRRIRLSHSIETVALWMACCIVRRFRVDNIFVLSLSAIRRCRLSIVDVGVSNRCAAILNSLQRARETESQSQAERRNGKKKNSFIFIIVVHIKLLVCGS